MKTNQYEEYERNYPYTVVASKEGFFYTCRGESANILHALFNYKGWKKGEGRITTGFPESQIESVGKKLTEEKISYVIINKGEIIDERNFGPENRYLVYANSEFIDYTVQKTKEKEENPISNEWTEKKTVTSHLTDEERRQCKISVEYIDRLLDGRHPVNNTPIEKDSVLMNDNVQRCFTFIADILEKISKEDKELEFTASYVKKADLPKPNTVLKSSAAEVLNNLLQEKDLSVSELITLINNHIDDIFEKPTKYIPFIRISNWLYDRGYLENAVSSKGSNFRKASTSGEIVGLVNAQYFMSDGEEKLQYRFTKKAQQLIFDNIGTIALYRGNIRKDN